jgi:uncharacterized protein YpmB
MARTRTLSIAAAAALLAIGGIAAAATQFSEKDELSEKKVALTDVPQAALDGAKTELVSVKKAELVQLRNGQTVYEIKGKNKAGKTVELYVSADGQVVGTEGH